MVLFANLRICEIYVGLTNILFLLDINQIGVFRNTVTLFKINYKNTNTFYFKFQ